MFTCLCLFLLFISESYAVVVKGSFEVTDKYPGGFTGRIRFPATQHYPYGWLLNITFDIEVKDFQVFEGTVIGVHPDNKLFIVRHQDHNKNLHRDASGRKDFYSQGKTEGSPTASVWFIPMMNPYESIEQALIRAEKSGVTGEYPSTEAPKSSTISFQSGWTPAVFEPISRRTTATTTRSTTTPTTPPLNLAALNLRYNLREVITKSLLFFEAQRSGALPDSNRIRWRSHSALSDGSDHRLDLSGGYYIDGGFVKYNFPMAFSTTMVAWGVIEFRKAYLASHQIPHVMNALKWTTDYFLKCHVSPFAFYAQVSTPAIDDDYWGRPEDYKNQRPSFKIDRRRPGSDLAAEAAAAMAATAIVFRNANATYSSLLISHAEQLYRFAVRYPGSYSDNFDEAAAYSSGNGFHDELAWGALWLYKATGKTNYLIEAQERAASNPDQSPIESFTWSDKRAGVILMLAQITRKPVYMDNIRRFCDFLQPGRGTQYTPRGLAYIDETGATSLAANAGVICLLAAELGINYDVYREFAHRQLSYILGDGGRSYVIGIGDNFPTQPFHRASSCPDLPDPCNWENKVAGSPNPQILTGALVSGPNRWDDFTDIRSNRIGNSVALHYNAGLQTLAAGILELQVTGQTFSEPNPQELNAAVSESFSVRHNYGEIIRLSLLFYEAQRAGELPNDNRIPWRKSAFVDDAGYNGEDLSGGYFDAGDYVKFNFPMAYASTILAWGAIQYKEVYEHVGEMDNCLSAIKWATDYFIKCHVSKYVLYAQVGSGRIDHAYWLTPSEMKLVRRPVYNLTASRPGTEVVASTAAALASASILFKTSNSNYSKILLKHAEDLYEFADKYREKYHRSIPGAARFYRSLSGYNDELVWSAMWLYSATGKKEYLEKAQVNYQTFNLSARDPLSFYWDDVTAGAQLLLAQYTKDAQYFSALQRFCDKFLSENGFRYSPRGLVFIERRGPLRHAAGVAFICLEAANLGIRPQKYRIFAKRQIHYMLGDSGLGSFVVGYGPSPPTRPRHRTSSCPVPPSTCGFNFMRTQNRNPHVLSGALVGGPDVNDYFADERNNPNSNRVSIDYNAGFQSAVAALEYLNLNPPISTTSTTSTTTDLYDDQIYDSVDENYLWDEVDNFEDYLYDTTNENTTASKPLSSSLGAKVEQTHRSKVSVTKPKVLIFIKPTSEATTIGETTNTDLTTVAATTTNALTTTKEATSFASESTSLTSTAIFSTETIVLEHSSTQNSSFNNSMRETTAFKTRVTSIETTPSLIPSTMKNTPPTSPSPTSPKPAIIRLTIPKTKQSLPREVVFMDECRPIDVFDLCAIPKKLFAKYEESEEYHCRYTAFTDCVEKQGVACRVQIWASFPFWNTQLAKDFVYFSDDEQNCKDPRIVAIEKCEVSGITRTMKSCFDSSNQILSESDLIKCRWTRFQRCVDKLIGHCENSWEIWKHWNVYNGEEYFNTTQRLCGNLGSRTLSHSYFIFSISCFLIIFFLT